LSRVEWGLDDDYGRRPARGLIRVTDEADWVAAALKLEDTHNPQTQLAAEVWRISGGQRFRTQQYTGACNGFYGCDGENQQGWSRIADLDFSPNGKWLYVVHNTSIRLWNLDRNVSVTLTPPGAQQGSRNSLGVIYATSISPDGEHLATGDTNGLLTVWDLPADGTMPNSISFQVLSRDPLIKGTRLVGFSRDSTFVAMGAAQGSLELCHVSNRCGSTEPSRVISPRDEGQWIGWSTSPAGEWASAVSETRRIHYFRGDDFAQPFYTADVLRTTSKLPITTKEYIIVSGRPGRQVASIFSPDGKWAAGLEVGQLGANRDLVLIKLAGSPAQIRLGSKELGCESFTGLSFDPRGKMLLSSYNAAPRESCASLIELPSSEGDVSGPLRIRTLESFNGGSPEFTKGGEFIIGNDSVRKSAQIWQRRSGDLFTPVVLDKSKVITRLIPDPLARLFVLQQEVKGSFSLSAAWLQSGGGRISAKSVTMVPNLLLRSAQRENGS